MACSVFSLVVFLSFCIPRGRGRGVGIGCVCLCVRVRALVLCLHTSDCLCLFVIGFCDVICDLTSLVCVCHFVVCLAIVRACSFICLRACVLLCGCLSLVSIFIFRKCCLCWRPSTASCKPTLSCTRASWPSRRNALERRSLACRYTAFT